MRTETEAPRSRPSRDRDAARARRAGAPVGPASRADRRGHAGEASRRRRPLGVPDRPGGADEHAQARRPGARLGRRPLRGEDVEIEVANDGSSDNAGDGSGHGSVGMRERVALCGGELESGPRPGGASRSQPGFPSPAARRERSRADRRRPGARPRRLQDDPRVGAGDRDRRRSGGGLQAVETAR